MKKLFVLVTILTMAYFCQAQELNIIEQDYEKALYIARKENKLIFINFYTGWCAPCKKLDRLVFQNDSIQQLLGKEFVLLRYDAENDKVFNLSKKHHISSYPTAIILNPEGYVLTKQYGFQGEDFDRLSENVLKFTGQGIVAYREHNVLKGYANTIDISMYPQFYIDYVNRDNIKVTNTPEFKAYWKSSVNRTSEAYFSTLIYFGSDVPDFVADTTLLYKKDYLDLYGVTDTETLFYFLSAAKFGRAISAKNQEVFDQAEVYAKKALSKAWTDDIIPGFKVTFFKAQNRWDRVFDHYQQRKDRGQLSHENISFFCRDVYKNCEDPQVIAQCMDWMQEITAREPVYDYLDTYAFLAFKAGNREKSRKIAELALAAARKENRKTVKIEELLERL
ncbi:thioredoxin family protein [Sinomicrobium oceani]|uniref:thioredoxin family protein n=1 Tax=Sinomicrobium oceani TaxID=1150368 RepID=UPI00227C1C01|nr:thioredoxin family protein [Sinomicrobium oceani]